MYWRQMLQVAYTFKVDKPPRPGKILNIIKYAWAKFSTVLFESILKPVISIHFSRIPTINSTLGQKSPRIGAKSLSLSNQPSLTISNGQRSSNPQRLSPRSSQEEPPPLPPRNPPAHPPKALQQFLAQQNK